MQIATAQDYDRPARRLSDRRMAMLVILVVLGAIMAGAVALAARSIWTQSSNPLTFSAPVKHEAVRPTPQRVAAMTTSDPAALEPISAQDALAANNALAVSDRPNPAASPFVLSPQADRNYLSALNCMTAAIYYEAGNEPIDGERGVAQVILNRVRHPAYPKSVCGVVYQGSERRTGCQFTFTCDGSLTRTPLRSSWIRAQAVAAEALAGQVYAPVGLATHYHANYVFPYWAPTLLKTAIVGTHIFYRWDGSSGLPGAFRGRYAGEGAEDVPAMVATQTTAPVLLEDGTRAVLVERRALSQDAKVQDAAMPVPGAAALPATGTSRWALGVKPAAEAADARAQKPPQTSATTLVLRDQSATP